jgi:hypothetical protein
MMVATVGTVVVDSSLSHAPRPVVILDALRSILFRQPCLARLLWWWWRLEKDEVVEGNDSRCPFKKANALDVSAEAEIPTLLKAWLAQKSDDPARSAHIMRF